MQISVTTQQLVEAGIDQHATEDFIRQLNDISKPCQTKEQAWQRLSTQLLSSSTAPYPFSVHLLVFSTLFPHWRDQPTSAPAWIPSEQDIATANITQFMNKLNFNDLTLFHQWTTQQFELFWERITKQLSIVFSTQPTKICDLSNGVESPSWFPGSALNIAESCFTAKVHDTAILYEDKAKQIQRVSYGELDELSNQIANSLIQQGLISGDAIGIVMPMNVFAIAIYLGIVKMGGVVVSIADSFSTEEMAVRITIAQANYIVTQDVIDWGGKKIPLYERVKQINASVKIVVVPCEQQITIPLRPNDIAWDTFLSHNKAFNAVACAPQSPCNILFSSGTTGIPKALVWNHTTAIKAASDGYFHQNIKKGDVIAWPTNLGWMMGPWLIFAALINHATIALYTGAPKDRAFGEFIEHAKVNILGVVPTLVATWRQSHCMENLNWQAIKLFSSTGECSNAEDMFYLMSLAGFKPVIEYCGGTEIGGAYLSSTVITNNYPSLFNTPTMGMDFTIIDENGKKSESGEVAIIPPSIGLSTQLLNANHHETYFANMPQASDGKTLRRHGDQIIRFSSGQYCILGRVDDTMKLGGIKTSAAEIERTLAGLPDIIEIAAIAISPPTGGPSLLVIYAETAAKLDKEIVMKEMQKKINSQLNPLFKIHDVIFTADLPKTASNKIMRRVLRKTYEEKM